MATSETPDVILLACSRRSCFARIQQEAGKIVYSRSLETIALSKTRIERAVCLRCLHQLNSKDRGTESPPPRWNYGFGYLYFGSIHAVTPETPVPDVIF